MSEAVHMAARMLKAGSVRSFLARTVVLILMSTLPIAAAEVEPDALPSWNDTATKQAILEFVAKATTEGDPNFVRPEERIAVFDMDGTLVPEKPVPLALVPILSDIKEAVARKPFLLEKPAVAAILHGDDAALHAAGAQGIVDLVTVATDGKTPEDMAMNVRPLLDKAKQPKFDIAYSSAVYQPMRELLALLATNGFQNWICSGSPVLVTRELSEDMFGIPAEHVIGSSARTKLDERNGRTVLVYDGTVSSFNDGADKPVSINMAIGRRPVFVAGNEGGRGDVAMMRWSRDRDGPSFQLLINHDDGLREYAYSETDNYSLDAATKYGFHVVSMKDDWKIIIEKR